MATIEREVVTDAALITLRALRGFKVGDEVQLGSSIGHDRDPYRPLARWYYEARKQVLGKWVRIEKVSINPEGVLFIQACYGERIPDGHPMISFQCEDIIAWRLPHG